MTKAPDEFDKLAYRFWSIHPKDIPDATGMPDNYPGGKRAWFYANQMRDHALALVAAENEACAKACEDASYDGTHPADDMAELGCLRSRDKIRARTPDDATAALERVKQEAWKRGMNDAADAADSAGDFRTADAIRAALITEGQSDGE